MLKLLCLIFFIVILSRKLVNVNGVPLILSFILAKKVSHFPFNIDLCLTPPHR
jgi:hypothetical protein